jgi:putative zinc finger protein
MADCSNVEIRELLPERAGGALSVADVARVDAHLGGCTLCSAELALIQSARRALRVTPTIDVGRIRDAVVAATAAPSRPQLVTTSGRVAAPARRPAMRWIGLKAAAAVAIAAAGIGSFAVWNSANESASAPNGGMVAAAPAVQPPSNGSIAAPRGGAAVAVASAAPATAAPEELGVAGGLADLSESELQALLGDMSAAEADGFSTTSFDEPDVITPSVGLDAVTESI